MEREQAEKETNAMILPAPLKDESRDIQLVDLSKPGSFSFDNCEKCFPQPPPRELRSRKAKEKRSGKLEVVAVGAYNVSVAKSIEDLHRIDENVFKVADNIAELLSTHYGKGFGFVICAFDPEKEIAAHPMGYVCDYEADGSIFVPCRHEHGDGEKGDTKFDHFIYSVNTDKSAGKTPSEILGEDGDFSSPEKQPSEVFTEGPLSTIVPKDSIKSFRKKRIFGSFKNDDLHFGLA